MHSYYLCVNDFFSLSLPSSCSSPLSSSHNKTTKSPLPQPQPPISIFFRQQNHKTTLAQPQPQIKVVPPKYKTQKLKLAITHHNTKTQKLKLAITHHRTSKNQMKSNPKINQNPSSEDHGNTTSKSEVAVVGRYNWGLLGLLAVVRLVRV